MIRITLLALPLAACSSVPASTYAQPTDAEAKTAFLAGQRADADMLEGKAVAIASQNPVPAIAATQDRLAAWDKFRNDGTVEILRKTRPFDRVTVTNCAWEKIDKEQVGELSQGRVGEDPPGAYHCDEEVFVSPSYGGKAKATSRGYFYKTADGQWLHLGGGALHYEPI